ncbi:SDR family oxidoreductase [Chlorobium phaeobacteroides]|uniref:Uncharacterized protein n=1 Tax=Chlorobium phaeobacteroides (strain DSM 266 / SMG 266 / 2430) TaxID=290317 RepID=A1BF20_CHLPD|nr:hypothetical protein [Chlorobium phaeobacteroides]ABL64997.1 hypothetical protein Cpha266_0949 [Chlorobium phaeobacteroides DSM 266]
MVFGPYCRLCVRKGGDISQISHIGCRFFTDGLSEYVQCHQVCFDSLRHEFWDENIRLSTVIFGTAATPIRDKAGGAPESAIMPEESTHGNLKRLAASDSVVIVTDCDREGAVNAFLPEAAKGKDEYLLNVARQRKIGQFVV